MKKKGNAARWQFVKNLRVYTERKCIDCTPGVRERVKAFFFGNGATIAWRCNSVHSEPAARVSCETRIEIATFLAIREKARSKENRGNLAQRGREPRRFFTLAFSNIGERVASFCADLARVSGVNEETRFARSPVDREEDP